MNATTDKLGTPGGIGVTHDHDLRTVSVRVRHPDGESSEYELDIGPAKALLLLLAEAIQCVSAGPCGAAVQGRAI